MQGNNCLRLNPIPSNRSQLSIQLSLSFPTSILKINVKRNLKCVLKVQPSQNHNIIELWIEV